jgi:predicted HicB family RNase H-like nuclease
MDLTPHIEAIRSDLEAVVATDEAIQASFERVTRPLEASLQLRLLDLLGDGALELTEQLGAGHAEVRVAGRDARLVYVGAPEAPPAPPASDEEGGTSRLTLRMPDVLKAAVEEAADALSVSVNTWLVQAVQSTLGRGQQQRRKPIGNRITGYARS